MSVFTGDWTRRTVQFEADARTGELKSGTYTIGTSVETITIPATAIGFRIYPLLVDIRFAVDEDPQSAQADTLRTGGTAIKDMWEVRLLKADDEAHSLRLLAPEADVEVHVEVF